MPWLIIGGLLWAGIFVKPAPVGKTVQPPILEKRDRFYGMAMPEANKLWLAGSGGKIIELDRDGRVTQRLNTPTDATLQDIVTWDAARGVAVGNDGIVLVTGDRGASWAKVADVPRSEVANKLTRVRAGQDGKAVAVGEMGAMLVTRDYGATWARLRPEEDIAWNDVALLPGGKIVAVGEFGHIVLSSDDGKSWADVKAPIKASLMAVAFRDDQVGVAVGLEGSAILTRDGGRTWSAIDLPIHEHLFDIAWNPHGERWTGTGNLGRWISSDARAEQWQVGRLDERDLSWHTRLMPAESTTWFTGANVGHWDGQRWIPLGETWHPTQLLNLPVSSKSKS